MWNTIHGIAGNSDAIGATLGLIWFLGVAIAAYAWLKLPPNHRHR